MLKQRKKTNNTCLVIDLEACCWLGNPPQGQYNEIIEIGVVSVGYHTKDVIKVKSIIVKPEFSEISKFCTELTTLTPEYIEEHGVTFSKACEILEKEFDSNTKMWISWGDYDRIAFQKECELKNVKYPLGKTHFNLKEWFALQYGMKQSPSLSKVVKSLGAEFVGTKHRGVDDARMTAVVLKEMLKNKKL
jgi:inhibitor of KinA sporulation pathway (predicted exonuclease)